LFFFGLTIWRDLFKSGTGMLTAFSELIGNEDFKKTLGQASGLLAIVVTAYEIIDKAREDRMTDSERAHNRLLKYMLKIIKESLKENQPSNDINKKKIYEQISAIRVAKDKWELKEWNSNLPEHPAIKEIIGKINDANKKEYKEVVGRISYDLVSKAQDDSDYKVFKEWWTRQEQYRDLIKHLEKIENLRKAKFDISNDISNDKPLQDYYVDDNVIADITIDTLNLKDDQVQVQVHNGFPVKEIRTAIRELILNSDRDQSDDPPPIVIAGSFGIGKTSAMKMLSADYATEYLNSDSDSLSFPYIPILVSLEKEKENNGKEFSDLDRTLNKIAPAGNEPAKNRRILILFDSLEKYNITSVKIGDKIEELRRDKGFRNVRAIITMNLNQQLLSDQNIKVKSYTRMLPFNSEQLDKFFEKYEVKEGEHLLTHERAIELDLPVQEMFRPLFAWIFSYQETSEDSRVKIVKKKWTSKMKKAWMYYIFFHRMIAGIPMEWHTDNDIEKRNEQYLYEKYLLRAVAALKQIHDLPHEKPIPVQDVEKEIKSFAIPDVDFDIDKVKKSYFLSVHHKGMEKMINFVHESFSDYLLAEYYIWTILIDKKLKLNKDLRLNIGFPNRETIDFLEGILDILNEDDEDVENYISSTQTFVKGLLTSFRFSEELSVAKEELITFTSNLIKKRHIIFYKSDDNPDKNQSSEGMWMKVDSNDENYKLFWIHRWICLYILNKLIPKEGLRVRINDDEDLKERLATLIRYSGNLVPGYIKNLRYTDLSGADLRKANLFRADLSHANLRKANLFRADLSGANLKYADLSEADLTDVNMSDAKLFHAKLPSCVLSRANLSDSNFEEADLSNAKLSYAILSYANLSKSKLLDANLSYANFSDANLTSAIISDADLSYANFSDATLTDATIEGCKKFENLVCYNANFNGVTMDKEEKELLKYLKDHNAMNIPEEPGVQSKVSLEVKITSPSDSECNVPTSSIIMATFNDTILEESINKESFKLYTGESPEKGSPVKGSVSLLSPDHKTAVFIPDGLLEINAKYHVKISAEVCNIFHNKPKDGVDWNFTTANTAVFKRLAVLGITASGDDGNVPKNAIDNELDTRWTDIGRGKWIQMDLGEPKNISYLQIAWFKGNRRIYDYEITFFDDKEKFDKEEIDKTLRKEPLNLKSKESLLPEIIPIEGNVKARYVRIKVNGNTVNNWASITSIGIFG
jgi:uncharacterized protein YjbI with pentapeptide repeats